MAAKKKGKKKSPKGTKIRFTLNRDADVAFTINSPVGRKVKGKCVKAKKNRRGVPKKKRCVRWVPAREADPCGSNRPVPGRCFGDHRQEEAEAGGSYWGRAPGDCDFRNLTGLEALAIHRAQEVHGWPRPQRRPKICQEEQEDVEDVEEDSGGERDRLVASGPAQAVEVNHHVAAEDDQAEDRIGHRAAGDAQEDLDDAEDDQSEQREEEEPVEEGQVPAGCVATGAERGGEERGCCGRPAATTSGSTVA